MRLPKVSVAAMVMATPVVLIPFCGSTVLPPKLTPAQRESLARAPFHNITVGVERFERPVYQRGSPPRWTPPTCSHVWTLSMHSALRRRSWLAWNVRFMAGLSCHWHQP